MFLGFPHCPSCSESRHEIPIRLIRHHLADPASAKHDKPSHPTTKDRPSKFHRLIFLEQSSRNNDSYHPGTARASQIALHSSACGRSYRWGGKFHECWAFQNGKATNALGLEVLSHVKNNKKTSLIFGDSTYVQIALRPKDYLFQRLAALSLEWNGSSSLEPGALGFHIPNNNKQYLNIFE